MPSPEETYQKRCKELAVVLAGFDTETRVRGNAAHNSTLIRDVVFSPDSDIETPLISGQVYSDKTYKVSWFYNNQAEQWLPKCTCSDGPYCKHAYALGLIWQNQAQDIPIAKPVAKTTRKNSPSALGENVITPMRDLLEERLGRRLEAGELRYLQLLAKHWRNTRHNCLFSDSDLCELGLANPDLRYSTAVRICDWWDHASSPATLLEFWQYLAYYADRQSIGFPPFLRPVTDTSNVLKKLEAIERLRQVVYWTKLFAETAPISGSLSLPSTDHSEAPVEIRLNIGRKTLSWEFRDSETSPWHTADERVVHRWLEMEAKGTIPLPPASLALLQLVALDRFRANYWSSAQVPSFKLKDERTGQFLHKVMRNPTLRHLVVSENGEPYSNEIVPLHWVGRPLPDRPDDVVFELTLPDGSAAPGDFLRLKGEPELGLFANSIYQLPVPLPGHVARNVVVPREVLTTVAAARRLRHCGAVIQGVDMPQFRLISMRPRFVCEISESRPAIPPVTQGIDLLMVEVQAVDPDGSLIQTRMGDGRWITKPDTKPATTVVQEIDRRQAESAVALLYEMNLSTNYESHKWWCSIKPRTFPETFVNWVKRLRSLNVEVVCSPELATLLQPPDKAQIELSVHNDDTGAGIDWFDVGVSIRAEDTTLTQDELKLLLKAQGQFVRLSGKGWRRLDVALTPEQEAQLAELGIESSALHEGEIRQRFHALQLADERIAGLLPEEHAARARERAGRLAAIAPPPVPSGLSAELRPYQLEGYHFLAHLTANNLGGILADDMGLGKTVQALTWLLHLSSQLAAHPARADRPLRALVVCPKSVVPNWTLEARRFTPKLLSAPLTGGALPEGANLVVVNYAQLRLAATVLNAVDWDAVILDEGQNIKNPQSLTARTARELRAANRIILTGTPIENRTLDLWSLFAFAMPGLLGTQASFRRTFNDKADPAAARARLARRVRHFMLRRTKSQVAADLPPRTEEDLAVELEGVQRQLYDAELKRTRAMLLGVTNARDFDKKRFNILQSLLRLRQICCDPRLVGLDKTALANDGKKKPAAKSRAKSSPEENDSGSAKLDALLDALEPLVEEGHRVLVFSQFVTMLEIIATELKSRGIGYLMLTGQTENRQELVDRFQSPEGESVFLLSLKAAGAGLNLTAASYVVLYDPWWNPAVEAQAIDRTHRIGQTEHVIAYRLIARNTIEEKIRKLQQSKADLARSIVQEETLATVMSLDDLRFVLSDDTGD